MPSTPLWKLRRLAPRALRVLARRKSEHAALAAFETRLVAAANNMQTAYDATAKYEPAWRKEMDEGRSAIGRLVKVVRVWMPQTAKAVAGFDASSFMDNPTVGDDVLEDAGRFHDVVADYRDAAQQPLPFQADCLKELDASLQAAHKEWSEAEASDKAYQDVSGRMRVAAGEFDAELQAFRKTLAAVAGRSDRDFQKLRAEKAHTPDEEDDPTAPNPAAPPVPGPGAPGAPGGGAPQ